MCNFVLGVEVHHMLAHEVGSIVRDNGIRKPEATNNVFHRILTICCSVTSENDTASKR